MIAHRKDKRSNFRFSIEVDHTGRPPTYTVGERFWAIGKAQKAGYLYLFHMDKEGNFKLLYPLPGQNNVVPAGKEFKVGSPNDPDKALFQCGDSLGTQRLLAFVTTRPLKFSGVGRQIPKPGVGQEMPFRINPQTRNLVSRLALEAVGGKPPDEVDEKTGLAVQKLPFEFAMAECLFHVAAGKP